MLNRLVGTVWTLLALAFAASFSRAGDGPRLKTSWTERDVRVETFSPDGKTLVQNHETCCLIRPSFSQP